MNVICPTHIECPGSDFPILNISSEAPDFFCFWNYIYNVNNCATRLNCDPAASFARDCFSIVCSNISQAEADVQARLAQANCNLMAVPPPETPGPTPTPPPPPQTCSNEPQTATVYCSNGDAVSFTTPAGTFSSPSSGDEAACLANVNAQALAYAEQQASAQAQLVCPKPECTINTTSPLPSAVLGVSYSFQIVGATTGTPVFSIQSGNLPPGLSMSSTGLISGTPSQTGTYQFQVKLTGTQSCTKNLSILVNCAPDFTLTGPTPCPGAGSPYSVHVTAICTIQVTGFIYTVNDGVHGNFQYPVTSNNEILLVYGSISQDVPVTIRAQWGSVSRSWNITIPHVSPPSTLTADFGGGHTVSMALDALANGGLGAWSGKISDGINTYTIYILQSSSENSAQHGTLLSCFVVAGINLAESQTKTTCRGDPTGVWSAFSGMALPFGAVSVTITKP